MTVSPLARLADKYGLGFLAYGAVSAMAALCEWGSFFLTLPLLGLGGAAAFSFFLATTVNFILCRRLAFCSRRAAPTEFLLVMAMSLVAFAGNMACFLGLHWGLGVAIPAAKIAGTFAGFGFNYIVRQFFVFSRVPFYEPVSSFLQRHRRPPLKEGGRPGCAS
jgi:putative flippase GtrA